MLFYPSARKIGCHSSTFAIPQKYVRDQSLDDGTLSTTDIYQFTGDLGLTDDQNNCSSRSCDRLRCRSPLPSQILRVANFLNRCLLTALNEVLTFRSNISECNIYHLLKVFYFFIIYKSLFLRCYKNLLHKSSLKD